MLKTQFSCFFHNIAARCPFQAVVNLLHVFHTSLFISWFLLNSRIISLFSFNMQITGFYLTFHCQRQIIKCYWKLQLEKITPSNLSLIISVIGFSKTTCHEVHAVRLIPGCALLITVSMFSWFSYNHLQLCEVCTTVSCLIELFQKLFQCLTITNKIEGKKFSNKY